MQASFRQAFICFFFFSLLIIEDKQDSQKMEQEADPPSRPFLVDHSVESLSPGLEVLSQGLFLC